MSKGSNFVQVSALKDFVVGSLLDQLDALSRSPQLIAAGRRAGEVVLADAIPRIPKPGYKGDKKGLKPLNESLAVVVREYPGTIVILVGGLWPSGAHMHLVEFGHMQKKKDGTVVHVPPNPCLRPAAESTQDAQKAAIVEGLTQSVNIARRVAT
jgi:hypothetical protein